MIRVSSASALGRRDFLRLVAAAGLGAITAQRSRSTGTQVAHFPPQQERLLDAIEQRAANFFYEEAGMQTGLVRDRARMNGPEARRIASAAATGFGLSALCVADKRGYLQTSLVRPRVERTLEFVLRRVSHANGFLPHFLDIDTGKRAWRSEYSSIDTTWLLCGALHAAAHFQTGRIERLANDLYQRVDWKWMLDKGDTLRHGWTPERGFLPYRWDAYSELLAMYLLAIGSPSHPIPAASWDAWKRPLRRYDGLSYIETWAPLFAHQYSHAWFDFRGRRDRYADYFENSRLATEAHRRFCEKLTHKFPWYGENLWGVTASDSRRGYLAWGGPFHAGNIDGTVVPCAAGGSIAFLPNECATVLETMMDRVGSRAWGRYGFVDAFHPEAGWFDLDVVGINQGITALMAENARTGLIWDTMASSPHVQRSMARVGLVEA